MKLSIFATTLVALFANSTTATGVVDHGGAVAADVAAPVAVTPEAVVDAVSGSGKKENQHGRGLGKKAQGKEPGYDGYNCKLCPDDDY